MVIFSIFSKLGKKVENIFRKTLLEIRKKGKNIQLFIEENKIISGKPDCSENAAFILSPFIAAPGIFDRIRTSPPEAVPPSPLRHARRYRVRLPLLSRASHVPVLHHDPLR